MQRLPSPTKEDLKVSLQCFMDRTFNAEAYAHKARTAYLELDEIHKELVEEHKWLTATQDFDVDLVDLGAQEHRGRSSIKERYWKSIVDMYASSVVPKYGKTNIKTVSQDTSEEVTIDKNELEKLKKELQEANEQINKLVKENEILKNHTCVDQQETETNIAEFTSLDLQLAESIMTIDQKWDKYKDIIDIHDMDKWTASKLEVVEHLIAVVAPCSHSAINYSELVTRIKDQLPFFRTYTRSFICKVLKAVLIEQPKTIVRGLKFI